MTSIFFRAALAAALLGSLIFAADAAGAAVVCQKGKAVKLRPDACKPGWTTLATLGGTGGDPAGFWRVESGDFLRFPDFDPLFIVLNADGTGRVNVAQGDAGVVSCLSFSYALSLNSTFTMGFGFDEASDVVRYSFAGSDELDLASSDGKGATLSRQDSVDPDADCRTLEEVELFAGLPVPSFDGGLAFDGTRFWYTLDAGPKIVAIDPGNGTIAGGSDFDGRGFPAVHASAGADFWAQCGGCDEVGRLSLATKLVVDKVQTGTELGTQLRVDATAFDPASGRLWLSGTTVDGGVAKLLVVDPSSEPDRLIDTFDTGVDFNGIAFDGTSLWAIQSNGNTVTRIDPSTGEVTGNFTIPDHFARWRAIAIVGDELALAGSDNVAGAILKLRLPPDSRSRSLAGSVRSALRGKRSAAASLFGAARRGEHARGDAAHAFPDRKPGVTPFGVSRMR